MLEGINIISTEVTKDVTVLIFIVTCVIACLIMFWAIWLLKIGFNMTKLVPHKLIKIVFSSLDIVMVGVCLFFSSVLVSRALNDCFFNPVYDTEYTVTISDEVSYNEFIKKYEIIEYNEENNTYVIREKENVD